MLRDASKAGDFRLVRDAWLGGLFDISHQVVLEVTEGPDVKFYLPGFHFQASGLLAVEVSITDVEGYYGKIVTPQFDNDGYKILSIFNLQPGDCKLRRAIYTWRSWLWQWINYEKLRKTLKPMYTLTPCARPQKIS